MSFQAKGMCQINVSSLVVVYWMVVCKLFRSMTMMRLMVALRKTEDECDVTDGEHEHHAVPKKKAAVVRVTPKGGAGGRGGGVATKSRTVSPAARARANHRRAKARLAPEDTTGALEDAKEAAYLGDRNAVSLYGKLIRESSGGSVLGAGAGGMGGDGGLPSNLGEGGGGLADLLAGNNPLLSGMMGSSGSSDGQIPPRHYSIRY